MNVISDVICSNNAPQQRGRGRGRGRGAFNNRSDGYQQGENTADGGLDVQIRGWDGAENRNDVVAFLHRKFGIQIQNPHFEGQYLYCTAPNPAAYQTLLNASGVRFAGKSLQVNPSQSRSSHPATQQTGFSNQHTQTTYEILKGFLSRRYNAELGLLDLSNLAADETLQGSGFFNSASTQAKVNQLVTNIHTSYSLLSCALHPRIYQNKELESSVLVSPIMGYEMCVA